MVAALRKRSEAEAAKQVATEYRSKAIKAQLQLNDANKDLTTRTRTINTQRARAVGNKTYKDTKTYKSTGKWAKQQENLIAELNRKANEADNIKIRSDAEADKLLGKYGYKKSSGSTSRSTPSHSSSSRHIQSRVNTTKKEIIPEGSIKDLQNKISKLKAKIEVTIDPNTISNLQQQINAYQDKIKALEIPIKFQEDINKKGVSALGKLDNKPIKAPNITVDDKPLDKDWGEKLDKAEKIQENVQALEDLKAALSDVGGTFGDITSQWADLAELFEMGADASVIAGQGLVTLGKTLQAIGGNGAAAKVGAVMAAIGQIILGFTAAAGSPAVTSTGWGWLAFVGAGLAAVATTISTLQSFSTGGIIQGGQIAGDQMLARVNAGEMILNGSQQKNLFNLLDSGGALAGSGNGNVEFKISGSSLKGVLRNYDSKMNKIR